MTRHALLAPARDEKHDKTRTAAPVPDGQDNTEQQSKINANG